MMWAAGLLIALLCSFWTFDRAGAETPAAACLAADGQRLYNMQLYRNIPLAPGCKAGDSQVRFQLEQPSTTVSKLRGTLTEPGEQLLSNLGGFRISQVFEPGVGRPCWIQVSVTDNGFRLGGVPESPSGDISLGGADFIVGQNFIDGRGDFGGSISGGPLDESQFFLQDGSALFVEDVVVITDFGPVPHGCFAAATVRYAQDARSLYAP